MNRLLSLLDSERPLIMGILNVTPDSFSDGGSYADAEQAAQAGMRMVAERADLVDVGGESTRPGSEPVPAREQIARVVPVIRRLRDVLPDHIAISVDTTRAEVAHAALSVGADCINDVSAGRDDPEIFPLAAECGLPIVLMHMQGTPKTMQDHPSYRDVVEEVITFLLERARAAERAGIPRTSIVLDPGIGFGKRRDDNLRLLAHLGKLVACGYPVLLGTSRKRFMGSICGETDPRALVSATVATTALGVVSGVRIFRVHDVWQNRQAADVAAAIQRFAPPR
jgi:dihydropteroate synthase